MSTAAADAHLVEPAESPLTPESWGKLGMWNFLAADAMSFGGLLAAYGALRYGDPSWPKPSSVLGIQLTALMTFLLILSSVTMVEALAGIRSGDQNKLRRFLLGTILGGMTFLGFQSYEWTKLIVHEGQSITKDNFGATFFILTGFHGCHVLSGVVYLSAILGRSVGGRLSAAITGIMGFVATAALVYLISAFFSPWLVLIAGPAAAIVVYFTAQAMSRESGSYSADHNNEVEIAALYWHFVDLIWILVFTFVYLL